MLPLQCSCILPLLVVLVLHHAAASAAGTAADWQSFPAVLHALQPVSLPQQEPAAPRQLLQEYKPFVIAHRGASGPLPEHTAPAYLKAIEQGADFIECDVVVTKDLQLICRHEPNLNDTTDAWQHFGDRAASYMIDGQLVEGIFASDLTLAEVKQLRATQRWSFRDHSFDGLYGIVTFEEYIDLAQAAVRPVGIYPEVKHPTWHNKLPALQAANTTIEALMVRVLHSKGYKTSAPFGSDEWRMRPVFIQNFEVTSLQRLSAMTPVPLALLLDKEAVPDTGMSHEDMVSDAYLAHLASFVTVVAPWKSLLYNLTGQRKQTGSAGVGLVLPSASKSVANSTDSSRRLLGVQAASDLQDAAMATGFAHPDVPLSDTALRHLQQTQQLQSTGLTARLHRHGFQVHAYTLRDEGQFVLPTCKQGIVCEFDWLFVTEELDGGFADWPGTLHQWLQHWHP